MSGVPTRLVSAVVPCRNERSHIEAFCEAVLAQRLPPGVLLEVLVADGRSNGEIGRQLFISARISRSRAVSASEVASPRCGAEPSARSSSSSGWAPSACAAARARSPTSRAAARSPPARRIPASPTRTAASSCTCPKSS